MPSTFLKLLFFIFINSFFLVHFLLRTSEFLTISANVILYDCLSNHISLDSRFFFSFITKFFSDLWLPYMRAHPTQKHAKFSPLPMWFSDPLLRYSISEKYISLFQCPMEFLCQTFCSLPTNQNFYSKRLILRSYKCNSYLGLNISLSNIHSI